ncbi:MAG: hypothetical protein VZR78_05350, partial [Candidatus Enteromonas sp.]|nr:hypothetical protein [Candidatus Enteromonas sp.]
PPISSSSLSSSGSSSSSTHAALNYSTIASVKEACSNITDSLNSAGYVVSGTSMKVKAKVLAIIDSIATKANYNVSNQYKAYIQDASGCMYAAFDSALYAKVKNYVGQDNTVYTLTGRIGRYYDQPELIVDSYTFEDETLTGLASFSSFEEKSLSEIKSEIASLPISEKGVSYGRPIVFNAKYVDELVQENLLFSDNELTIQLHGSSKISNSFVKGNNYKVAALLGLHIYKPSLTFLGIVSNEASTTFNPAVSPLSATELYNVKYTKDSASHATNYENVFYSWRRFRGYVSCYQKDGKSFFVLDDTESREFPSYTAALNAKTIFVNNESEKNIYSQADANGSILLDYYQNETEIIIDYVPYLYNTNRYWQIFANLSSISVAE